MRMCQCTVNDKHRHSRERDKIKRFIWFLFFFLTIKIFKKKNQRAKNPPVATSEKDLNAKHNCCTNNKKSFVYSSNGKKKNFMQLLAIPLPTPTPINNPGQSKTNNSWNPQHGPQNGTQTTGCCTRIATGVGWCQSRYLTLFKGFWNVWTLRTSQRFAHQWKLAGRYYTNLYHFAHVVRIHRD